MLEFCGGIAKSGPNAAHVRLRPLSPNMAPPTSTFRKNARKFKGLAKLSKCFRVMMNLYQGLIVALDDQDKVIGVEKKYAPSAELCLLLCERRLSAFCQG